MSDVVIVGGGPAGAIAAAELAAAARPVTLFERSAGPVDKVCGDFLSAEAVGVLGNLGVDLSAAAEITSLRLIYRDRIATTRLPFVARGLSRRALDEALLRVAVTRGAAVMRGHHVRSIRHHANKLRLDCGTLGDVSADTVFLATGKHNLRGAPRAVRGIGPVGFKIYYALTEPQLAALRGHIEMMLLDGGYAGLQQVEGNRAVLCALLPAERLRAADGRWTDLLDDLVTECPHLGYRLAGARALLERPCTIAGLPYGYLHTPRRGGAPGVYRIGDQAAVIASLTGDGIALALASATLAARAFLGGRDARSYHRDLVTGMARQMRVASMIHRFSITRATQPWVQGICRHWPGAMRLAASLTRTRLL